MAKIIEPGAVAKAYRDQIRQQLATIKTPLKLVGFLASDAGPSHTYAEYTRAGCDDVGIHFELRELNRLELEGAIEQANADTGVHGILVYYPIFDTGHDSYIKDLVDPRKDIEGLNTYWVRKLYHNVRFLNGRRKAILPCTPLAIVKLLDEAGGFARGTKEPLAGKKVAIFNRSEVVGRPLATMLANDGAEVYSFDVDGLIIYRKDELEETELTRSDVLGKVDVVITGVPSREFPLVRAEELKEGVIAINFSTIRNFHDDVTEVASAFIPRVGPMTVTMALRNTLRLYRNFHAQDADPDLPQGTYP